jgi:hypothetical protein
MARLMEMVAALPDAITDTARRVADQGLGHPNLSRLQVALQRRVVTCAEILMAGEGR